MNSKIKFVVIDSGITTPLSSLDMDVADEDDELEKQILIGLGLELDGKAYKVVNQIVEAAENERSIIYYVEEITAGS